MPSTRRTPFIDISPFSLVSSPVFPFFPVTKDMLSFIHCLLVFISLRIPWAGAKAISLHLLVLVPGERGRPHLHKHHETALYVFNGQVEVWYGEQLQKYLAADTGDFLYIPAGMPHLPGNRSQTDSCLILIARTDPNEQESVVLLPQLDEVPLQRPDVP